MTELIYLNINEEGEIYNRFHDLDNALLVLDSFPNDSVEIRIVGEWNRWLWSYEEKPEWWDDETEPRCDSCGIHTEDADVWCGECGNCEIHCQCEKTEIKFAQEYYRLHGHAEGIEDDPCPLCGRS